MMIYPFMHLFFSTLIMSTLMALSSHHWMVVWMSLELNMISFIPLMSSFSWNQEHEAALKYLMFQALGSSALLLFSFNTNMSFLVIIALSVKLGVAPFHLWFPSVMKSMSWFAATLLMTWQKIAPMVLILSSTQFKPLLMLVASLSAISGGIGGMNQTHLRPLLAYSSVGHMGWMLAASTTSPFMSISYFSAYLIMSLTIMLIGLSSSISSLKQTATPYNNRTQHLLIPAIISLGGLPPLMGFIPKLMVLSSMNGFIVPFILITGSLMNLTYYLNFFMPWYMSLTSLKKSVNYSSSWFLSFFFFFSTTPIPFIFFMLTSL
uniref:NADH-ubiquinone oxidoreductase chain 2 n=1 Tax=Prionospio multibranchiata TaxID=3050093 RepID=A0AAU6QGD3_9ANNE